MRELYEAIMKDPHQLDKDLAESLVRTPQAFNDDKRRLEGRLAQLGALLLYMGRRVGAYGLSETGRSGLARVRGHLLVRVAQG